MIYLHYPKINISIPYPHEDHVKPNVSKLIRPMYLNIILKPILFHRKITSISPKRIMS